MSAAVFPLHRYKSSRAVRQTSDKSVPAHRVFFFFTTLKCHKSFCTSSLLATGLSSSTPPLSFSEEFRRLESESLRECALAERRFEMISFQVSSSKRRDVEEKPTAVDVGAPARSRFTLWKGKCQVLFARAPGCSGHEEHSGRRWRQVETKVKFPGRVECYHSHCHSSLSDAYGSA